MKTMSNDRCQALLITIKVQAFTYSPRQVRETNKYTRPYQKEIFLRTQATASSGNRYHHRWRHLSTTPEHPVHKTHLLLSS